MHSKGTPAMEPASSAELCDSAMRTCVDLETKRTVEEFLFLQAEMLDGKRWAEFIDSFTDDGIYWMPARPEQTTWKDTPSIFAEDRYLMTIRMKRMMHPRAWSQAAEWGTSHLLSNVRVSAEDHESNVLVALSRFHVVELRGDGQRHFTGSYFHRLLRTDRSYKILLERVDLLSARATFDYVIQAWI